MNRLFPRLDSWSFLLLATVVKRVEESSSQQTKYLYFCSVKPTKITDTTLRFRASGGGASIRSGPVIVAEDGSTSNTEGTISPIMEGGNQFENLKREATKLERQLEEKIGRYQQVRSARPSNMHVE